MTPATVFVRTLLKSSAIFIGAGTIILHPSLEWRSAKTPASGTVVGAQASPSAAAIQALIIALQDSDAGVRREAARALESLRSAQVRDALEVRK